MKAKLINQTGEKRWALIFDKGDEIVETLTAFAKEQKLDASHFTGIGAFDHVTLGYFDRARKDYEHIPIEEQVEVLSLIGDIAVNEKSEPVIHMHAVLGKRDGTAHGGHVLKAKVWPTIELIVSESPEHLRRKFDPETHLPLIDLSA
ncbi:MAG TPA: PPC domain-containing DNA-binding protein [Chthoniobacteraceae bacterium]|nr:PPC domain-containing DNA-binding protein [Chthoniobacteraceae bacterium]